MAIQGTAIGNNQPFSLPNVMNDAERFKANKARNSLLGYQVEETKNVLEARKRKQEIERLFNELPARIAKYKERGMHKEAQEATQALLNGRKQELAMMEIMAATITPQNWKQRRQELLEAGAIDGSQMPTAFSQDWINRLLQQKKGEVKKIEVEYGETDDKGQPTGRVVQEDRLYQDGEQIETFTPRETDASRKARTGTGEDGKPWAMKSADSSEIRRAAADQFNTILGPNGEFIGLAGEDKRLALQLTERASEIYNQGQGKIPHGEAVAQAAREQGLKVKSTRNSLVNDPLAIR